MGTTVGCGSANGKCPVAAIPSSRRCVSHALRSWLLNMNFTTSKHIQSPFTTINCNTHYSFASHTRKEQNWLRLLRSLTCYKVTWIHRLQFGIANSLVTTCTSITLLPNHRSGFRAFGCTVNMCESFDFLSSRKSSIFLLHLDFDGCTGSRHSSSSAIDAHDTLISLLPHALPRYFFIEFNGQCAMSRTCA